MVKVEVFSTDKEAQEWLKKSIYTNHDVVSSMISELLVRATVYRASPEFRRIHSLDLEGPFTKEETQLLCKGLKPEGKANSFVRLYSIVGMPYYGFTYASVNPYDSTIFNSYDSVKSLAKRVYQEVTKKEHEILGIKTVPMLYTILEPLPFPEEKREQVRKSADFQALTLEQRILCEQELEQYREKGLTPTETQALVLEYVKFCN